MINTLPESLIESAKNLLANENFKSWFGKSILKHKDGSPMHMYHGTGKDFSEFSYKHVGKGTDAYGSGFYFTNNPDTASQYGFMKGDGEEGGANVMNVHIRLENPIKAETDDETPFKREHIKKLIMNAPDHKESLENFGDVNYEGYNKVLNGAVDSYAELPKINAFHAIGNDFYHGHDAAYIQNVVKHTGHDGVLVQNGESNIVNVFHPNQIKSAISNSGEYSKSSNGLHEAVEQTFDSTQVGARQSKLPHEHFHDVVKDHIGMGWKLKDHTEMAVKSMSKLGSGCRRSIEMNHPDGRKLILSLEFKKNELSPQTSYNMKTEYRSIK